MRKAAIAGGLVLAFFLGILLGIRLDWSTWLERPTGVTMTWFPTDEYEVESYGQANLMVSPGDVLALDRSDGSADIAFNFKGGNSPCEEGDGQPQCTILDSDNLQPGPYFFSCNSNDKKFRCPDPGIQPQTTGPIQNGYSLQTLTYSKDLADVWAHVLEARTSHLKVETNLLHAQHAFAPQGKQLQSGPAATPKETKATPTKYSAYIVCNKNNSNTAEVDPLEPHAPADTPISIPAGSNFAWVANSAFTVLFQNGAKPCGGSSSQISSTSTPEGYEATCTIATASSYYYNASLGGCTKPSTQETISAK
jgi:hypothetical protein